MSVRTVLIIAGFMLVIGLILAYCARQVRLHEKYLEECRKHDEEFMRRDPETYV